MYGYGQTAPSGTQQPPPPYQALAGQPPLPTYHMCPEKTKSSSGGGFFANLFDSDARRRRRLEKEMQKLQGPIGQPVVFPGLASNQPPQTEPQQSALQQNGNVGCATQGIAQPAPGQQWVGSQNGVYQYANGVQPIASGCPYPVPPSGLKKSHWKLVTLCLLVAMLFGNLATIGYGVLENFVQIPFKLPFLVEYRPPIMTLVVFSLYFAVRVAILMFINCRKYQKRRQRRLALEKKKAMRAAASSSSSDSTSDTTSTSSSSSSDSDYSYYRRVRRRRRHHR